MKQLIYLTLGLTIMLSSCSKNKEDKWLTFSDTTEVINLANEEFSRGLARAMIDPNIREFIKSEALKEVDKDFDVVYGLVKNKKLKASNTTFREELSKYMGGVSNLDSITQKDPTLTILVPYIEGGFNVYNWDIENQIPVVAYREHEIPKQQDKLITFDKKGEVYYIPRYEKPSNPILVVKSNERLTVSNNVKAKSLNGNKFLSTDEGEFVAYFISNEFCNDTKATQSKNNNNIIDYTTPILEDKTYRSISETSESPRDYIYYGISTRNNIMRGELNTNYREYLASIKFNSAGALSHVEDRSDQSVSADWSDGNLEIVLDFLFLTKDEILSKLTKMVSIRISDLFSNGSVKTYVFSEPIEIFNWDMYKYGSTFKVIVSEYDAGIQTELTHSTSTAISHNWEIEANGGFGKIWKIGAKYGGAYTENKQSSTKINFTNNSDPLGEVFVDFFNPILANSNSLIYITTFLGCNGYFEEEDGKGFNQNDIDGMKAWIQSKKNEFNNSGLASRGFVYVIHAPSGMNFDYYKSNTGMISLSIIPMKAD
ncbi:MAG: hypothetical protein LBV41_06905 [Cytophagaceae bacterium]|jgi:hypothetical protein|nr:hypothetical protein [Cytophagaceae bacterium]